MTSKKRSNSAEFPNTLEQFGYAFNADGELRKIDPKTGQPGNESFDFNVKDDLAYNQKHYEALGEVITEHVYKLLESEVGLERLSVPRGRTAGDSSFVFVSDDALDNPDRLVVLIHGSGVVRAGQWARSLIINDSLKTGTQLPFISRAKELGYGVLVMNSNDNERIVDGKTVPIKDNKNPTQHCDYVWDTYIKTAKAKHIAIIAHSYGGVCTVHLATEHLAEFRNRVFAVALTDSVHSMNLQKVSSEVRQLLQKVGRNWVCSWDPLDTPVTTREGDVERVSAGVPKHEMTSWSSLESVFKFLQERYWFVVGEKQEL